MVAKTRELYISGNGDRWLLVSDAATGRAFVRHEPNLPSGGRPSEMEVGVFLRSGHGPEHQALLRLIGGLVEDDSPP